MDFVLGFEMRQVNEDPSVETSQLDLDPLVLQRVVPVVAHPLRATVQVLEPKAEQTKLINELDTK